MKIQISQPSNPNKPLLLSYLLVLSLTAAYNYSSCNSSYYFNPANLACVSCQNNQIANSYQTVPTACQCSPGYLPATNGTACTAAFTTNCTTNNSYYPIYNINGSSSNSAANCLACAANAYTNK